MKIQDLTVSKEMEISEMSAVHGGESNAPDPISFILNAAATDKGAYGVIAAASQIELGGLARGLTLKGCVYPAGVTRFCNG